MAAVVVEMVVVKVDGIDEIGVRGKNAGVHSWAQSDSSSCLDSSLGACTDDTALWNVVTNYMRDDHSGAYHVFASSCQKVQTDGLEDVVGLRLDGSTWAWAGAGTEDHEAVEGGEGVLVLLDRSMQEALGLSSPEAVASCHPEGREKAHLGEEWERNRAPVSKSLGCIRWRTHREKLERLAPLADRTYHNTQRERKDLGEDVR